MMRSFCVVEALPHSLKTLLRPGQYRSGADLVSDQHATFPNDS